MINYLEEDSDQNDEEDEHFEVVDPKAVDADYIPFSVQHSKRL
jgi:hypothetical protein